MRKKVKQIIIIIFILLFSLFIFDRLSILLIRKGNGYGTDVLNFYKLDKNSIDMLILGSSHAYTAFNPYQIEKETGLKTYDFCTQQQPLWITYYYLNEALKYQKPKYIVLEAHMAISGDYDYAEEQVNRDAIDKMRFSINKINAINTSIENKDDRISYYLNIIKYHSRYKELNIDDFKTAFLGYTIDNKGYIALPENDFIFYKASKSTNDEIELSEKNEKFLYKIIDLVNENKISLIIVKTPASYNHDNLAKLNYMKRISEENNILFLDYVNNIDNLDLEYINDFYDFGHLNKKGSEKFTRSFIEDFNSEKENLIKAEIVSN